MLDYLKRTDDVNEMIAIGRLIAGKPAVMIAFSGREDKTTAICYQSKTKTDRRKEKAWKADSKKSCPQPTSW